jgi:hypothetical protein
VAEAHLKEGNPLREIIELSEEIGAGFIVVATRGLVGLNVSCWAASLRQSCVTLRARFSWYVNNRARQMDAPFARGAPQSSGAPAFLRHLSFGFLAKEV